MMSLATKVFVISLVASSFASPRAQLEERAPPPTSCTGEVHRERACIASGGFPFVASLCAEYTPLVTSETTVDSTSTSTETTTTTVVTEFSTPPATATIYTTSTLNFTRINSSLVTVTSGFSTIYPSNATSWVTEYSTAYSCAGTTNVASVRRKRQLVSPTTTAYSTPTCLPSFVSAFGTVGIRSACDCLISAATGTTVVEVTNVVVQTTTTSVIGTTHVLPTITATLANSTTQTITRYVTGSTIVPSLATGVRVITRTTTLTTTLPTPTPSAFYLYYNDTASNTTHYAHYQESPAGTGTLISFDSTSPGDSFTLGPGGALIDVSDQGTMAANNTQDLYPLLYLNPSPTVPGNTPTCSVCNGAMTCGYPGAGAIGEFAVCASGQYLSLGPRGPWASNSTAGVGNGTCQEIALGIKAVPGPPAYGFGKIGVKVN